MTAAVETTKKADDLKEFIGQLKQLTPTQKEQVKGIMIGLQLSRNPDSKKSA